MTVKEEKKKLDFNVTLENLKKLLGTNKTTSPTDYNQINLAQKTPFLQVTTRITVITGLSTFRTGHVWNTPRRLQLKENEGVGKFYTAISEITQNRFLQ
ncbi:MAG: hypothetical protein O7D30_11085 [Rickettsia endosymbiont of Ixodes persulcatus]|nr:hypothetical protein [Rickettsia endosymbiont of Ixodes persulcatus]